MREVVIVDGVRVPIGKAGKDKGYYKDIRADDLGAMCIRRLLEKNPKLDPKEIEDVVWGCANQTGEQGLNVGRMIGLLSGLPVVATPNAGSIVQNGVDGFIVPIRDPDALAETIGRYASHPKLLAQHQAATLQCRKRAGLDRYKADLVSVIREISASAGCFLAPGGAVTVRDLAILRAKR